MPEDHADNHDQSDHDDHWDEAVAARYDARLGKMADPELLAATVAFLVDHARGGRALELGIGTGRVAVPLHAHGVPVHGIDLSEPMLARLRAKPGAEGIAATVGDFAHARAPGQYALAYLVFNTIMNLTSQDEQVACFCNVSEHLETGGRFVIEVGVPGLQRLLPGERFQPFAVEPDYLGFDEVDVAAQCVISHHYSFTDGRVELRSVPFRYVWPSELDLMARIAGMTLVERWADWQRSPFTSESRQHISVWQKG